PPCGSACCPTGVSPHAVSGGPPSGGPPFFCVQVFALKGEWGRARRGDDVVGLVVGAGGGRRPAPQGAARPLTPASGSQPAQECPQAGLAVVLERHEDL